MSVPIWWKMPPPTAVACSAEASVAAKLPATEECSTDRLPTALMPPPMELP